MQQSVIVAAKRTPVGAFQGQLSSLSATDLGAIVIKNLISTIAINPIEINEVIMGNVLSAGLGQAPARQAALYANLPNAVQTLTINKMCGSGLKAVMLADQAIRLDDASVVIAGGMESMSNAPYILKDARRGHRLGHGKIIDSMIHDGLWDVYNDKHMGNCAEILSLERSYTRDSQDQFATMSYKKALDAQKNNIFDSEIVPIEIKQKKGISIQINIDEEPSKVRFDKIPNLNPAFQKGGAITAANASKLNDGAAAMILMSEQKAKLLNINPIAKIICHASYAHDPEWFTTAPAKAIGKVLDKSGLTVDQIDLWEINEAFSAVTMAAIDDYNIDPKKVNIYGGAVALGHPIGASGARIMTTLLNGLNHKKTARYGLATLCIGGGEASAIILEKL